MTESGTIENGRGERLLGKGPAVIEALAARFPQLYVAPSDDEAAQELHKLARGRGIVPPGAGLGHFATNPDDELREVATPAGPVEVAFLKERADFETLLQIVSHKSRPVPIARTVGAITYRGLADWGKVAEARDEYLADGGEDWPAEFSRLAQRPGAFRAEIIVISEGPYSNVPAEDTPYEPGEWTRISREIRLHHECAHVVCRRLMPGDILPVWDEVTADVTGLLCATGRYDAALAARFLGVSPEGFSAGRLVEYLGDVQRGDVARISVEVHRALCRIEEMTLAGDGAPFSPDDAFGFLLKLKKEPLVEY